MVNEFRVASRCVHLVESLLREEYGILRFLQERGKDTTTTEFRIARMEYALGERETPPSLKDFKEKVGIV